MVIVLAAANRESLRADWRPSEHRNRVLVSDLSPLPQILRRADADNADWRIEGGTCHRGDAWTNHSTKQMRVPLADSPEARVVRAHEMAHARVSPTMQTDTMIDLESHYGARILACVEELRVNTLIGRLGFDLDLLHDGSEKPGGTRIATTGGREMWNEAVSFTTACVGSPSALRDFLSGVRKGSPEWAKALTKMSRQLDKVAGGIATSDMASTSPLADGTPSGYVTVIEAIGRVVRPYLESAVGEGAPYSAELARQITRAGEPGARRAPSGRWAEMVLLDLALSDPVKSPLLGRRRRAASSGTRVTFPGNALRDPHRRIFAGVAPAPGGVVVIDQSGSMDLSSESLDALLSLSPSLTVIGYSHRPGDASRAPNAWILARRGRRVASGDVPSGNIGNGVDLPVLEFAQRLRRSTEPLIWVCDGQTTDSNDHPYGAKAVAQFVRLNRVHCVRNVDALLTSLRVSRPVLRQMRMAEGRVGRSDAELATAFELTPLAMTPESIESASTSDWRTSKSSPRKSSTRETSILESPTRETATSGSTTLSSSVLSSTTLPSTTLSPVTPDSVLDVSATTSALVPVAPIIATSHDEVATASVTGAVELVDAPCEVLPSSSASPGFLATVGDTEYFHPPTSPYVAPLDVGYDSPAAYGLEI
jgi:hypothetical protein